MNGGYNLSVSGVEVVENIVAFVQIEERTRGRQCGGYRRNFEEAYTKIDAAGQGSTSHHRVVRYIFGGLIVLVRSTVDAYIEELANEPKVGVETRG